jgi:hypothetical protein
MPLRKNIDRLIAPLEKPMKMYPRTELTLVMVILPAFLNGLFAWVIDNLIQKPSTSANDGGSHEFELLS